MNKKQAACILDLKDVSNLETVKKQYRKIMHLVHPDAGEKAESYPYTAQEINEAYTFLTKNIETDTGSSEDNKQEVDREQVFWNAEENLNAFCSRNIYHTVEDSDGEAIGDIVIAKGKYFWTQEEDFKSFQKSIFQCSKALLEDIDCRLRREDNLVRKTMFQAELTFLLAGQFVNSSNKLDSILGKPDKGIYYVPAMLEAEYVINIAPGALLYPKRINNHRIYVGDSEKEIGYISFDDDRLYFAIIPLAEQKILQYKLRVADKKNENTGRRKSRTAKKSKAYIMVDMWVRFRDDIDIGLPDSVNNRIEEILKEYSK